MANVTTGSNYAKDWPIAVPIRPELANGPFLQKPEMRVPHYVLTKTHCYGYCADCYPKGYEATDKVFEQGCLRSEMPGQGDVHYASSVPVKAVHLFRNPFDNIVARMHLAVKRREKLGRTSEHLPALENSKEGLDAWCLYLDTKYTRDEGDYFSDEVKAYFDGLPCHAEWYRYVQWHNHAFALTEKLDIPVHNLFYEDYTNRYDETVADLLDFLETSPRRPPIDFYVGKTYEVFFEEKHARKAAALVRALGSTETWGHTRHYFERYID